MRIIGRPKETPAPVSRRDPEFSSIGWAALFDGATGQSNERGALIQGLSTARAGSSRPADDFVSGPRQRDDAVVAYDGRIHAADGRLRGEQRQSQLCGAPRDSGMRDRDSCGGAGCQGWWSSASPTSNAGSPTPALSTNTTSSSSKRCRLGGTLRKGTPKRSIIEGTARSWWTARRSSSSRRSPSAGTVMWPREAAHSGHRPCFT